MLRYLQFKNQRFKSGIFQTEIAALFLCPEVRKNGVIKVLQ
nr:MAG TPA: hypothetical protein [Bacteriophage sp.]